MLNWYVTFGQKHPLKDAYVIVEASSYSNARNAVFDVLGSHWCFLNNNPPKEEYAPDGCVGNVIRGL